MLNYLGVRQGGIPAPCCFVVYLEELSAQLSGNLRTNYWLTMTTIPDLVRGIIQRHNLIYTKITHIIEIWKVFVSL